jgi:hypothetical protein
MLRKREKIQVNKIKVDIGNIRANINEIQKIIRE